MRLRVQTLIAAGMVLLAAACSPAFPTAQPADAVEADPVVTDAAIEAATDTAVPAPADPTDSSGPAQTGPTDLPPATIASATDTAEPAAAVDCPYNPSLHATDPAAVSLASGDVQLVEFFAFW